MNQKNSHLEVDYRNFGRLERNFAFEDNLNASEIDRERTWRHGSILTVQIQQVDQVQHLKK
jgi:hypothetical protein